MNLDLWQVIFLFTFFQAIVLSFSFFTQKKGGDANKIFGVLLLVISFILAESLVRHTGYYQNLPHFLGLSFALYYLIGPLYFFYFFIAISKSKWNWKYLILFLPVIIVIIIRSKFYLSSGENKIRLFEMIFLQGKMGISKPAILAEVLFNISCIILTIFLIKKRAEKTGTITNYIWVRILSYCFIVFWIIYLVFTIIMSYNAVYSITFGYIQNIGLAAIIIIISYYLINRSEAFEFYNLNKRKYSKSILEHEEKIKYAKKILKYLNEEKPFFNNEFNLSNFSKELGISSNKVSQTLNEELGVSFHDLINEMRIEEMKKRLLNSEYLNLTIQGIAFDVGFNSKTAMVRNFKKFTNMTPSEFKKETLAK